MVSKAIKEVEALKIRNQKLSPKTEVRQPCPAAFTTNFGFRVESEEP